MTRVFDSLLIFSVALSLIPLDSARAQVSTGFDTGRDFWIISGSTRVVWSATGGNPDGFVEAQEIDFLEHNWASAPPEYLGDWSAMSASDTLSVDYYFDNHQGGPLWENSYVYRISGPGGAAHALQGSANAPSQGAWTTLSVTLSPSDWTMEHGTWAELLANVTSLVVSVEFADGGQDVGIDNVRLTSTPAPVLNLCVEETFNSGSVDYWMVVNDWIYSTPSSGGNGAGYLYVEDQPAVNTYAYAPGRFLGDWTALDGDGSITIDLRLLTVSGTVVGSNDFIRIAGPGGAAYVTLDPADLPVGERRWKTFDFPIDSLTWTAESGTWGALLAHVAECRVDLEYIDGGEVIGMDNFARLSTGCSPPDSPVGVDALDLWVCDRYSLIGPNAIALNPADGEVYCLVTATSAEGGGVYKVTGSDPAVRLQAYDRPSFILFDTDGDAFISEVYSGYVYRLAWGGGSSLWVSGFHSGDDDPLGMAFAPPGFNGPNVSEGDILIVDVGSSGPDDIWSFSPDTPENERLVLPDPGEVDLYDITSSSDGEVFVCDRLEPDSLFRLTADGALQGFALSEPVTDMRAIVYDDAADLLYVADRGNMSVKRVDPSTGEVSAAVSGFTTLALGCLEIDSVNHTLWVSDTDYNRVYQICLPPLTAVEDPPLRRRASGDVSVIPNPFNPSTRIHFDLDHPTHVEINIYDVTGRLVRSLAGSRFAAGHQAVRWDGRDTNGNAAASGVYFARVRTAGINTTVRLVLVR
ncbi:MAG: FlgD immunoglobulin-like domain containing protein [bacterium]